MMKRSGKFVHKYLRTGLKSNLKSIKKITFKIAKTKKELKK